MTMKEKLCPSLGFQLLLASVIGILVYNTSVYAENEEEWMPDPALREAVREKLGIPADAPLTQGYVQLHLTGLQAINKGVADLTGLEHATDLQFLVLIRNAIHDISPLSGLTGLAFLDLAGNRISDLSPLAGLINLEVLKLGGNQIKEVSPLAGLVNLKELQIQNNDIMDFSPLDGLPRLEVLNIKGNFRVCDYISRGAVASRIKDRDYPSIFAAWAGNYILNLPNLRDDEAVIYHDLFWSGLGFNLQWYSTSESLLIFGRIDEAHWKEEWFLSKNSNFIRLVSLGYFSAEPDQFPEDWPYWIRDEDGNRVKDIGWGNFLIDFTQPAIQDRLVERALAVAECGLYDGIFLDWWQEDSATLNNNEGVYYRGVESERSARISMVRRIRETVDDDFLIIVNTGNSKAPLSAPYVNGTFMEHAGHRTRENLRETESTLLWSEQNFREPQINALEGWGIPSEPLDSPQNRQKMRLITTLSLTHSDGYVCYVSGIASTIHEHEYEIWKGHEIRHIKGERHDHTHQHYWYSFWDADLGHPIGGDETKGQLYENREGLFIREFTNGWAVYNRSGTEQQIEFSEAVSGVASGVTEKRSHVLPDLDGEIYLKSASELETPPTVDINGDGVVNIQDLVIVANALGAAEPDLNGDGVVNIQDLVIVANAF